jgi:hypothetical protein
MPRRLTKEQSAKMRAKRRERSMRISDFHIGLEFWMNGRRYRTTDVGFRLVVAIRLDHNEDPSWYSGPPYLLGEQTIDEYDREVCSLTRHGGNSSSFSDEEVAWLGNEGMAKHVISTVEPRTPEEQAVVDAETREYVNAMREQWIKDKPVYEKWEAEEREALAAHWAAMAARKEVPLQ